MPGRRRHRLFLAMIAAVVVSATAISVGPAGASDPGAFYRGKTVVMYVGYPPGGGYDIYARVIARHLGRHIPGQPQVIVKNQPGAASMVLANQLPAVLPQDGTAIATFARSIAMDRLLGRDGASYDPARFGWIGSANNEVSICTVWHGLGLASIADIMAQPIVFGANAAGSESGVFPLILNNLLGARFKVVSGYPAANDLMMAMERGETQGRCGLTWSAAKTAYPEWIRDKKLVTVLQFATARHLELPDVPLVTDLARTAKERQALELLLTQQTMGRPFAAPPNVPADRLAALRAAFVRVMRDTELLAEADRQQMEIQPVDGDTLQGIVTSMFKAPPDVIEAARDAIRPR